MRIRLCLIVPALIISGGISTDSFAKKSRRPEQVQPQTPCPIDETLRVASGQALNRYTVLANCSAQIIVAPATEFEVRPTIRIVPQYLEVDPPASAQNIALTDAPTSGVNPTQMHGVSQILGLRPASYTTPFDQTIQTVAQRHRVDPLLLHAVIKQESGYRPTIRSQAGAIGLMQIMPDTGAALGVATPDLDIPESNVDAGARLLRRLYHKYSGDFQLVLAAYNAGEGAVKKYGNQIPPYPETQAYVKRVLAHYDRLVTETLGAGAAR